MRPGQAKSDSTLLRRLYISANTLSSALARGSPRLAHARLPPCRHDRVNCICCKARSKTVSSGRCHDSVTQANTQTHNACVHQTSLKFLDKRHESVRPTTTMIDDDDNGGEDDHEQEQRTRRETTRLHCVLATSKSSSSIATACVIRSRTCAKVMNSGRALAKNKQTNKQTHVHRCQRRRR